MNQKTAIIIDDESNNIELLNKVLEKYCKSTIEVVGTGTSVLNGVDLINSKKPQILFLDIILGQENSFEILERISSYDYKLVFITGYDNFALKAFKYNAIDYLMKPICIEELLEVIDKIVFDINNTAFTQNKQVSLLLEALNEKKKPKYIAVPSIKKVDFIEIEDILFCKSDGRYTIFYLNGGKELIATKNLGEYEKILDSNSFFRIHNSFIVNLTHVKSIDKSAGNYCELENGKYLPIAKRRLEQLYKFLNLK